MHPDNLFCPDILDHDFLVIIFQIINVRHCKYTANEVHNLSYQSINNEQQVPPGSKINRVELIAVKITLFKKSCLISVHVYLVSDLQTCCDDISTFISHGCLYNLTNISQLMMHVLLMYY